MSLAKKKKTFQKASGVDKIDIPRVSRKYKIYIGSLYLIVIAACSVLGYETYCRYYLPSYSLAELLHLLGLSGEPASPMEPGKGFGHTLGYAGSTLMVLSQLYALRKRNAWFSRCASRKFWLDTHIFLGILGAVFITFHTTFKIGGLVSVSYWSMVIVVMSGVIGRFLYVQIPRSIAGNELGVDDLNQRSRILFRRIQTLHMEEIDFDAIADRIAGSVSIKVKRPFLILSHMIIDNITFRVRFQKEKRALFRRFKISRRMRRAVSNLLFSHALIKRKIALLEKYQELLEYWRPTHIWLSIVMFIFMAVHVAIAFFFYVEN